MQNFSAGKLFMQILNWSEAWALLIPIFVLVVMRKKQPAFLLPVVLYVWSALVLNFAGDVIADFKQYLPGWLQSNNPLYNVHSLIRFACFSSFFIIRHHHAGIVRKAIPAIFVGFVVVHFSLYESLFNPRILSGDLLAVEAYLLLVLCMEYYLSQLRHDVEHISYEKDFWLVTGLSIFVVVNFFIFLFYVPMILQEKQFAVNMWYIHNVAYIIFCCLLAKAFYVSDSN